MTETGLDQKAIDFGTYLAQLPTEERKRVTRATNALVQAQLPDDEIGKPPIRSLGEYLDHEIELPPNLVGPGIIYRGAITVTIARGGKGKTSQALNRLLCWSMGLPLFAELPDVLAPLAPTRSLIIENEGSPGHFQAVLRTILHGEVEGEPRFTDEQKKLARENVNIYGDGGWSGLKMDDPASFDLVDRAIRDSKADIVFIEPFRGLWRGNENDSTEMANLLDNLSELANKHDCGIYVTHHENKTGTDDGQDPMSAARGSTAFEGHAAVMERWRQVGGGRYAELSWIKARFEAAPAPLRMEFQRDSWSYRLVPETEGEREVLQYLATFKGQWFSLRDIGSELEETVSKVRRWCNTLCEDGEDGPAKLRKRAIDGAMHYTYKSGREDDSEPLEIT